MNSKYQQRPNLNSKKPLKLIFFVMFLVSTIVIGFLSYNNLTQVNSTVKGQYTIEVKSGDNLAIVGEKLAQDNVVNQSLSLPIIAQTKPKWNLQKGSYTLQLPASPSGILEQLQVQSQELANKSQAQVNKTSLKIIFKEGDTLDDIISKVVQGGLTTETDMIKTAQDTAMFGTEFGFLAPSLKCQYGDLKNCAKYYLEGYLYPDTYEFYSPSSAKEIYSKMLKNFDRKVWQKITTKPTPESFAKIINMASVIERETGRPIEGVNKNNQDQVSKEKKTMAGVFLNRLEENMNWQSDPTVTYGTGKSLCQQTLKSQKNCLYINSEEVKTKYNTYANVGYPIAPTTNPTWSSIEAVLEPIKNDYLFFVSDASGQKYFAQSNTQHESNIAKVEKINQKYR